VVKANSVRGWRPVGIILSVIWFVGFGAFLVLQENRLEDEFLKEPWDICQTINDVTLFEECQRNAGTEFYRRLGQRNTTTVHFALLAEDLITLLVGWLIVSLGVLIVRWVARGFASV
jgi:hypothetical protein